MPRHTEPSEIDPAAWSERDTDAGTREPFADQRTDDVPYAEDAQALERYYDLRELAVVTLQSAVAATNEARDD